MVTLCFTGMCRGKQSHAQHCDGVSCCTQGERYQVYLQKQTNGCDGYYLTMYERVFHRSVYVTSSVHADKLHTEHVCMSCARQLRVANDGLSVLMASLFLHAVYMCVRAVCGGPLVARAAPSIPASLSQTTCRSVGCHVPMSGHSRCL